MNNFHKSTLILLGLSLLVSVAESAERLRMATTTSTENSGLLKKLDPPFEARYNVKLDVIAVGTGKALKLGENGDVDIVFVHAPGAEKKFVAAGFGVDRTPVMHNDFVILGPTSDPAKVGKSDSAIAALQRISTTKAVFVSRGDNSGTNKKEMHLWKAAGISPQGKWYLSTGQGMGAVLQIAADKLAYTLTDRGTYIAYRNKIGLKVLNQGDPVLFNPYHVMAVNPKRHAHAKYDLAKKYIAFVSGKEGQKIIADYRLGGQQLFYPDVVKNP